MDPEDYLEMMKNMQDKVDKGTVEVSFKNEIIVPENSTEAEVYIGNAMTNNYDMFITLFLNDTQEKIAQTGIIPLGNKIEKLTLDHTLDKGKYQGILVYNMIDENKQVVEQANLGVTIYVGK